MASDDPAGSAAPISAQVRAEIDALDRELAEIEMLVGQARAEAARHEQKRATAAEKLAGAGPNVNPTALVDGYGTLVTLTPWDAQEIWPLLAAALAKRPAVIVPFVTRPNQRVPDRPALGLGESRQAHGEGREEHRDTPASPSG